jgi:leucyl/phenylalanyl-tRNA--protein transferase
LIISPIFFISDSAIFKASSFLLYSISVFTLIFIYCWVKIVFNRKLSKWFFRLNDELIFPNPAYADPDGLLAIGGDLSIERLLLAYKQGIFPWYSEGEPILWYAPHERFVLFPEKFKLSKSLKKKTDNNLFTLTENQAFEKVIDNCAKIKRLGQDSTWITSEMRTAYTSLHKKGIAKSVEVWQGEELVGGLYGVAFGDVFLWRKYVSHSFRCLQNSVVLSTKI